ncbi:MAG: alpha-D-ribose 1-methylphosphonate 5-triphosphate diphosphatase, partial [Ahrensia sp.]
MSELILTNAQLVLRDRVLRGTLQIKDGLIADIAEGRSGVGQDVEDDYIIPGLIELHTDHLETHYAPRPSVRWNLTAAIQSHDAQIAASGITTVFDCLRLGSVEDDGFAKGEMRSMSKAIANAQQDGRLRAEHRIHLRCEVSAPNVLDHFAEFDDDPNVGLLSLMDHAPGQRQFQTMDQYILYYKKQRGLSDAEFDAFCAFRINQSETYSKQHRQTLAKACHSRAIAVASHDDATIEHVDESEALGVSVAEFPTSITAAEASHARGMGVLMG